jgi:putative endonuclease
MPHYVYILQSEVDGTFYVGSTENLEERIGRHNQGRSQYTRSKQPWRLVYTEEHPDRSAAVKRENEIKSKKKRSYIESLVRTSRP